MDEANEAGQKVRLERLVGPAPCPIAELREAILDVAPELEALPGFTLLFEERALEGEHDDEPERLRDEVRTLRAQKERLLMALRSLHDEQNDAPLESRRSEWESVMHRTREVLRDLETPNA